MVFVGLLWLLHHVLLPFVVGAAIAYMLDPLASRLTKRGMSRLVAALIILGAFVILFAGVFVLIAPVLVKQLSAFIDRSPAYLQRCNRWFRSEPSMAARASSAAPRRKREVGRLT